MGCAIARAASQDVAVVCRRQGGQDMAVVVPDYKAIPPEVFAEFSTVINCVGTDFGDPSQLDEANVQIPVAIAQLAAAAGVGLFVQMSSFSVFGRGGLINPSLLAAPSSAYGHSKLRAEQMLQQTVQNDMKLAIVRVPMLYGYGRSKLDDLLQLWLKLRIMPVPTDDIARSMLHYDLAAQFILWIVQQRNAGLYNAADPEPFSYNRVANTLRHIGAARLHKATVPDAILALVKFLRPALHASLFEDSLLNPNANDLIQTGFHSRLYDDIARIARDFQND